MAEPPPEFAYVTFRATHAVLAAEKLLKAAGVPGVRLVPVPSQLSSDCGIAVRFPAGEAARAAAALEPLADDREGMYVAQGGAWRPV